MKFERDFNMGMNRSFLWVCLGLFLGSMRIGVGFNKVPYHELPEFPDGDTDIVWYDRTRDLVQADLISEFFFSRRKQDVKGGEAGGREIVGTGDFNKDGYTDLLWRDNETGENGIWLLKNRTLLCSACAYEIAPLDVNYDVVGTGDFNGDGYEDILWSDPAGGGLMVWHMGGTSGTDFTGVGWIDPQQTNPDWIPVAAGDMDNDSHPDIIWQYLPNGRPGIWYMEGLNRVRAMPLAQFPATKEWRVETTGHFTSTGNTDLLWRNARTGRIAVWVMSGNQFLKGEEFAPLNGLDWAMGGTGGYTNSMTISVSSLQESPPSLTLVRDFGLGFETDLRPAIQRREYGTVAWTVLEPNYRPLKFTDTGIEVGKRYEYLIGPDYIMAGIKADPIHQRGRVVLVVDETVAGALRNELNTFTLDLIGDGWSVVRGNFPRHNDEDWAANPPRIAAIKQFIKDEYAKAPEETKVVILIGHLPVPYSGYVAPDSHFQRALPADGYYGDLDDELYTDTRNTKRQRIGLSGPRHENIAGDKKWDQDAFPSELELAVGRIDFAKLPAFGTSESSSQREVELIRQYFKKNRRYRLKEVTYPTRVVTGSFSSTCRMSRDMNVQGRALKLASRIVGTQPDRIVEADGLEPSHPALWVFHGRNGGPARIFGTNCLWHTTADFANPKKEPKAMIFSFYASFLLDWDYPDNFMRALLATPNYPLVSMWFNASRLTGGPLELSFESVAMGESLAHGYLRTLNDHPAPPWGNIYFALLGDPTLRIHVVAPPEKLMAKKEGGILLSWSRSSESDEYYVYRSAAGLNGPWEILTSEPVRETNFTDDSPPSGSKLYMVRARKLVTSGSGSYLNLSSGIMVTVD